MQSIAVNFNRMVSELSQVFDSQRRFVADASHELKTPLTSIQTMVELLRDYQHFVADQALLFQQLDRLLPLHGREQITHWKTLAAEGRWQAFVETLLVRHYDPAYDRSMQRNYAGLDTAERVTIGSADDAALNAAAAHLQTL